MVKIKPDRLADVVCAQLNDYAKTTSKGVKKAVSQTSKTIKENITTTAPRDRGRYARSWRVKTIKETMDSLIDVIYTPSGYRIAHLLEYGHVKRNGGRVEAKPHIKTAEEQGIALLEKAVKDTLS